MFCSKTAFRYISAGIVAATLLTSCRDELTYDIGQQVEGEDAMISLNVALPEMRAYSRADLNDDEANSVNSLWVGIYNAKSGERTFSRFYESDELTAISGTHESRTLSDIETLSGESHIVAVANVYTNAGVSPEYKNGDRSELHDLLDDADSYEKYLSIAVISPGSGNVDTPIGNLPMSGVYYEGTDDPQYAESWEMLCDKTVYIPASNSNVGLPGEIHLRRLTTQIRFNIKAGESDGVKIISLEPFQWQVFNVPEIGWLHERGDGSGTGLYDKTAPTIAGTTNAGDILTCLHSDPSENYGNSVRYPSQYITKNGDTYSFDFYQMENKRTGLANCKDYSDREKEYNEDGSIHSGKEEGSYEENAGVYASLCGSPDEYYPNNYATYVQFKCRIEYLDKTTGDDITKLEGATRTAEAVYTVHLGYVNDYGLENKAQDFRSLRNSKYTYNVTITDVKNLLLEAHREGEDQPGAEGIVTDVEDEHIILDSHYSVFNIKLSDQQRQGFRFLIMAYYDNALITIQETNYGKVDEKFWKWVEFRPTTAEGVLADYKPLTGTNSDGKTFTLIDILNGLNPNQVATADSNGDQWYTVFVDEYVYGDGTDDEWRHFVNQPPRRLFINVMDVVASDGQTAYFRSRYGIEQKSIQTYYDLTNTQYSSALGVEHVNESFGLNLRWIWTTKYGNSLLPANESDVNSLGLNSSHGRINTIKYMEDQNDWTWKHYVNTIDPYTMPEISRNLQVDGTIKARPAYIPALQPAKEQYVGWNDDNKRAYPDPIPGGNVIEVLNACMNRNRDLDGDGLISNDELRWYLPSTGRYLRIILGSKSLETPLMDHSTTPTLLNSSGLTEGINNRNTRYHFATSDGRVIWAEENLAVSYWGNSNSGWQLGAWDVRCARTLGVSMDDDITEGQVAYVHDKDKRKITMKYYETKSVRQSPFVVPPRVHTIDESLNACYKAFEYDEGNTSVNVSSIESWYTTLTTGNPCAKEGQTGWRVPNLNELAIMRNLYGEGEIPDLMWQDEYQILLSCTKEIYANDGTSGNAIETTNNDAARFSRFMGANTLQTYAVNTDHMRDRAHWFQVRCVRDIEP